jgi:KAP family P-loop domain
MKANEIVNVLNHFKNSSYQKILINGNWGIGKTKYVTGFIESYSNVCYVSLFGKRDINSIIQEIYFRIIETAPKGNIKKYWSKIREKMNTIDVSYLGLSISIPVIENLHNALNKELGRKATYIIVFDDLERKNDDLNIKEVFGMVDSLSRIENIKTVLVAATDQLHEVDLKTFEDYKEKAIDRIYTVDEYASEAPERILGEHIWNAIGKTVENFEFKNLRTFEKTKLFIEEIIGVLGNNIFSDQFTRNDLYRMCFATVLFIMEHHGKMKLLNADEDKGEYFEAYYKENENGVIEYMNDYVLRNALDNIMSKNVFHHIMKWYETGSYSIENILSTITIINNYEETPKNFYSSEEEILGVIEFSKQFIRNLNGTERIEDIVMNLNTAFTWCGVLSVKFGISNNEILKLIRNNISNHINFEKNIHDNEIDSWDINVENEEARNLLNLINESIKDIYFSQLLNRIINCYLERSYNNYHYLRILIKSISTIDKNASSLIRDTILETLDENEYFFPIPAGKLTEDQWQWCHLIVNLVASIERYWDIAGYFEGFSAYIFSLNITEKDKLLRHRLNHLFGKNH